MHFALLLLAVTVPLFAHDWLIVPGERVGPVTARSTEDDLQAAFGSASMVRATIQIDKTTAAPGVEISRGRPGESLAIVWPRKERGLWWPLLVIPCYGSTGAECKWRTAAGVRVGLSVAELEKLNGKPFLLFPSQVRHVWTEPWWDEGKLAGQLGEDVELYFEDPDYDFDFYAPEAYMPSNKEPLTDRVRRIDRIFAFLLSDRRTAANDWTIVPGERIGPIPMRTAAEPLRETLGADLVHRVLEGADEAMGEIPGISIFRGQVDREVVLRRDGTLICHILPDRNKCRWHIAGGIPFTSTVEALEKRNGRPFVFNGFAWDLGGIITSWEGGRLKNILKGMRLWVDCGREYPDRMDGDGVSLRSDDRDIRKLKCTTGVITF
jgi:hypothetical protein